MNEIVIEFIKEFGSLILSGLTAVISPFCVLMISRSQKAKIKLLEKELSHAKEKECYTVCPHCQKDIRFSDLTFYLPSGDIDNNLNGIADKDE